MAYLKTLQNITDDWKAADAELICVGVFQEGELSALATKIDHETNGVLTAFVENAKPSGKPGTSNLIVADGHNVVLLGLGKKEKFNSGEARNAAANAAKDAISRKFNSVAIECFTSDLHTSQAVAEGLVLGSYQYLSYKAKDEDTFDLKKGMVIGGDNEAVLKGTIIGSSVCFARDLENAPGNATTPTRLAEAADEIAKAGGMELTVFDRKEIIEMGMGGLAGVASGTDEPPKFIVVEYNGAGDEKPVVLVGKGLTFDSGGISIKPGAGMDEMKFDMCGSGVVLGVLKAVSVLKPKLNLVGIVPSTENLSGGNAYKPGDILKTYNGKTVEVLNTDAEGRLILADGLSYASKHYDPKYILDFATLTGAVIIALGHITTGIMGTDNDLIEQVKAASEATGEKVWELPLWDEYCDQIKSKIADVKNIGEGRESGTIAAGAFLKEFVKEGISWVHFDIAGTAWGKESPLVYQKGATGEVIRLVLNLIKA